MMQLMLLTESNNLKWAKIAIYGMYNAHQVDVGWWCSIGGKSMPPPLHLPVMSWDPFVFWSLLSFVVLWDSNRPHNAIALKTICSPTKIIYQACIGWFHLPWDPLRQGDSPQLLFDENAYIMSQWQSLWTQSLKWMVCLNPVALRNVPCKKPFEGWRNAVIFKPVDCGE